MVKRLITKHLDPLFFDDTQRDIVNEFELFLIERFERRKPVAQNLAVNLVDRLDRCRGST